MIFTAFISSFCSLLQEFQYIHHYFNDWLCCGYSFSVQLCKSLESPCNYEKSSSWKHYTACQGIHYFIQAIFLQTALSMILMGSQQSTTGQWPISDCFQLLILQSILYYVDLHLLMPSTVYVLDQYRYILTKLLF